MVILVLNCGSSSIKYQVIDMEDASSKLLAKGIVERIGLPEGDLTHKPVGKEPFEPSRFPTTRPASSSCSTPSPTPPTA
jgi:acetate kinase